MTHLLLYKKIKIENTNINTYLNNSDDKYAFKNNDTVIVDPAGLPFMKADSSPSGVSDIIKVFLKEVPYPCLKVTRSAQARINRTIISKSFRLRREIC